MNIKRYDWEDALVDAQTTGLIPNGALLLALKLARAINWSPTNKRPAGLYWKNEEALKSVGASRASYFKHRESLLETGFFVQEKGNLLPTIPEKSLLETTESLPETEKSLVDNPLSEDTFSEDVLSEEEAPVAADASPVPSKYKYQTVRSLPNSRSTETVYMIDLEGVTKTVTGDPQSLVETERKVEKLNRILTPGEKMDFERAIRVHKADATQAKEALAIVQGIGGPLDIYEATTDALVRLGAVQPEAVEVW